MISNLTIGNGANPASTVYECDPVKWLLQEQNNQSWYLATYPNLKYFTWPISMEFLKEFYINDMNDRNLEPNTTYYHCYAYLFSYLLGRISGQIDFVGRNWFERLIDSFPAAINKTFGGRGIFTNLFEMPLWVYLIIGLVIFEKVKS